MISAASSLIAALAAGMVSFFALLDQFIYPEFTQLFAGFRWVCVGIVMMFLLMGLQRIPTEGNSISTGMALPDGTNATGTFSPAFLMLGRHRLDFILDDLVPLSVVFLIVIALLVWGFLELTRHGRVMYAIGNAAIVIFWLPQ